MNPKDAADKILNILKSRNVKQGECDILGAVNLEFMKLGHSSDDFSSGLNYAQNQGYIKIIEENRISVL